MAFNNNTAALLSGVLMVICIFVVMGEIRFRGTQTLYQSGKGVIRPYPLKTLSAGKQILVVSFFTTIFVLSIGVPITMLIYWLTVGSLEQMSSNIEKVGQSLGRSNFYIFRTLVIPAMLPGIAAAFALVFLNLMKELTATLLLTPNDIKTLSTAVWEYTSDAQYAAATPYAIMLVLFSGIPVFLLKRYGFK